MKIATWNVNGIRARAAQLSEWLQRDQPDIVCLQELKATAAQIPAECKLDHYHAYWHCLKGYSGVSLHVRKDLYAVDPVFSHPPFDMESRIVQVEHGDLVIASIYVPNGGKDYPAKLSFVKNLIDWAARLTADGRHLLLCGDLNIARLEIDVHPKERKLNAVGQRPEERALFETLLGEQLVDLGRQFDRDNPNLFTWWAPWRNLRARNIGWRLDYLLASPFVAARASSCVVQADVGTSDHAPVMLTLAQ
ncbi:MAG TPA: exodeoxyribonuclease III [Gemmatimonadales bacterium]|nr:exodeoxyribonuclease III [Gemmatimonadales bacterium]